MISFNKDTKQLEINDNYKGRLTSSRIISTFILVMGIIRLTTANWNTPKEMDYVFTGIVAYFLYVTVKNFLLKTADSKIDKTAIKYVKLPKGLATKAVIKLNNKKSRDVFGLKTAEQRTAFKKVLTDAKIKVTN